ncbi:MAG: hypothetical protein ACREV1_16840 [Gammaproteobacteria bacterium]
MIPTECLARWAIKRTLLDAKLLAFERADPGNSPLANACEESFMALQFGTVEEKHEGAA